MVSRSLVLLLALAACDRPDPLSLQDAAASAADSLAAVRADPPFENTWWRLASLGGDAPTEGVRPVLIFTDTPALRDTYDRAYPDSLADWRIVTGDLGVGHLHAPYRRSGDTLRFASPYDGTRLSTAAEQAQAERLAGALLQTRTGVQEGPRLALLGARGDTLALFTADPPRPPGPLDDTEWVLETVGNVPDPDGPPPQVDLPGRDVPDGVRADLSFSSRRLGPGPDDGFYAFGGYSGCNWYSGGYRLSPGDSVGVYRLATNGPVIATQRGCGRGPQAGVEDAVHRALSLATEVRLARHVALVERDRHGVALALHDSTGALLLVFRRHEPHPVDLGALRSGRWRYASSEVPYAPDARGAALTFADSTFVGTNGCQRVTGTYRVDGDDLFVQTDLQDEPPCPDEGVHRPIPLATGKVSVTRDRLALYDENGAATTFTR